MELLNTPERPERLRVAIRGAVQGVGFRPFVYRLAHELGLAGWVSNSSQGVRVEVEGAPGKLQEFLLRLGREKPPHSFIQSLEPTWLELAGYRGFEIRPSTEEGSPQALILPDIATCPDCLRDVSDPRNRRYRYPFTNCTHCGPRFSIIEKLPYDRLNTTMRGFRMCAACQAEYDNPLNRRFHAQPNACPQCGPTLELWDSAGRRIAGPEPGNKPDPLTTAAEAIRAGQIVAVKGLGGFHLVVAARDDAAVHRLRARKQREEKPLALMFPTLAMAQSVCEISPLEERLLCSPEAPIVLLLRRRLASSSTPTASPPIAPSVASNNPNLGVMLPYTPLHHLLTELLGCPIVATSGNLSDEPICIDEHEAVERLHGIADLFLVHNRPIARHVDDSIVRVVVGRELVLRRARGYAPLPLRIRRAAGADANILAVGAHLKNSVALATGPHVFISQHIGDLETAPAYDAFRRVIADFERLYAAPPEVIVADAHPDYLSTQFAREHAGIRTTGAAEARRLVAVQHHAAHAYACLADNELEPPALSVSWDGTGYGADGTVWGGEFIVVRDRGWERVGHLRQFRLPGGDAAVKEPRRSALGLLYELLGAAALEENQFLPVREFTGLEVDSLRVMLSRGLNSPLTSSMGRLFDGIAALTGLRQRVRFEGQAAMELEFTLGNAAGDQAYEFGVSEEKAGFVLDWGPVVRAVLEDLGRQVALEEVSLRFHNALAEMIVTLARRVGLNRVLLTGGCFQNRYLTERTVARLRAAGFEPAWHQRVPPNDGGICLGQAVAALHKTV